MRKSFLAILIIVSIPSYGSGFLTPDNTSTIAWMNVEPNKVRVGVSHSNRLNPDNCGANNAVIFTLDSEYKKAQYASLLAAYASGKNVRLYVSGCSGGWGTTYPKLQAVYSY